MPLVAMDTNVLDLFVEITGVYGLYDELEAIEDPGPILPREHYAAFWLLALAPAWSSTLYTFSDLVYSEVEAAARTKPAKASALVQFALDAREQHPEVYRVPADDARPDSRMIEALGLKQGDAVHVADAVGLGCDVFLTCDKGILRRGTNIRVAFGIRCYSPWEFLVYAVRAGAPWPVSVPWPWDLEVS